MSPTSRHSLAQQFKTINYIGLAMITAIFVYAGLVIVINNGFLPIKIQPVIDPASAATIKYLLIAISICHYFLCKFFIKISQKAVNRLSAASLLVFALSEAVALYGLIFFLLTGLYTDFFIFMALSLFYFYIFYPRYQDWERLLIQELGKNKSRK